MIDLQSVSMFFKIEVLREEHFTQEQKDELIGIVEKIDGVKKPKTLSEKVRLTKEYGALVSDFFNKFEQYGGDVEKLENVKNQIIPYRKELEAMLGKLRGK